MTYSKILAAMTAVSLIAAPAAFAGSADVTTKPVSVAGLDLNSPAGAEIALDRIEAAAESVCDYDNRHWKMVRRAETQACTQAAIKQAVKTIGNEMLIDVYKVRLQTG
ncbi:MAG: UrcA family protein [Pseudomonadota bacterium]